MDRGSDKEIVDIHKHLKSTITMLNHKIKQKNITISIQIDHNMPEFFGYVSELNQVWTNLIDNAIDAVPDAGNITITSKNNDNELDIYFLDNGSGIPEEVQNKIFDPFFTTKDVGKGTGLGLDVVRKIVDKHQGRIEVKSKPGNTQFKLSFPLK